MIALIGFFLGCKSINTVERATPNASPNQIETKKFVTDRSLNNKIQLISMNETEVSGNILKVQAELRNKTKKRKEFYYQFEWYDADGMLVPTPASASRLTAILPGEFKIIADTAPSPRVVDFRLKLKEN